MKNLWITTLLLLSLLACSEDEEPDPHPYAHLSGEANLLLNGEPYEFSAIAGNVNFSSDNLILAMGYRDRNGLLAMTMNLSNFPAKEGTYTLRRKKSGEYDSTLIYSSVYTTDEDVIVEAFGILEDERPNELIITRYDSVAQRIEGRFQMTVGVRDDWRIDSINYPDTLRITYGTFETDIVPPEE